MEIIPKVSIIIPVYNGERFIKDALDSVKAQTYSNWECIVIDDGSNDNSAEIIRHFLRIDERYTYIFQSNRGLSGARNTGIENANGDFIQFLDADDILLPAKLETHYTTIKKSAVCKNLISYSDYSTGQSKDIYSLNSFYIPCQFIATNYLLEFIERWETGMIIPSNSFLFSASIFRDDNIRFDETLPNHEDFDCWLTILARLDPQITYIDQKLCIYRVTDNSMSKNMKLMGQGFLQTLEKHIGSGDYKQEILRALKLKRIEVLKNYLRFDLMNWKDKILSVDTFYKYYRRRLLNK
ncbi:MAG: glycosyltransferase family 2 protein [Ferruginibacter sp.]